MDFGPEAWIVCPEFRLRGRVDEIRRAPDGAIEIIDFKTGPIWDDAGKIAASHALQVGVYALAVERVLSGARVRPYLEGEELVRVPWDEQERARCGGMVAEAMSAFPPGESRAALSLARPGPWCRGCRLRPVCNGYLDAAPRWWQNGDETPSRLPLDIWGSIRRTGGAHGLVAVEIEDAAGRHVRIEGLGAERGLDEAGVGDDVFFFDLKPAEAPVLDGAWLHPRNFHEVPPDGGLRFERARSLQVYRA